MSRVQNLKKKTNNTTLVYSRTKEEKQTSLKRPFYLFLFFLFMSGVAYVVLFSPLFSIKKIEVKGYSYPKVIEEMATEKGSRGLLFKNNLIFFSKKNLANAATGDPKIKNIQIKKRWPNKLLVEIEESRPALIWVSAGEKFLIDDRGVVIGPASDEKLNVVFDGANIITKQGERVASPTFINFINNITTDFKPVTGTEVNKITIFDLLTDVHILSSDGWTVYLDATKSAEAQLKNLSKVLEEASKNSKRLEYIDMRLDKKIFYK